MTTMQIKKAAGGGFARRERIQDLLASNRAWTSSAAVVAALAVAIGGVMWTMRPASDSLPRFRDSFDSLREVEKQWSLDLLALELGIAPNYDSVAEGANRLVSGVDRLSAFVDSAPELAEVAEGFDSYASMVDEKIAMGEQIAASYAMLRNSASVLPAGISTFFDTPGIYDAGNDGLRASEELTRAVISMAAFVISPSEALATRVEQDLAQLRDMALSRSTMLADTVDSFAAQADVVVRERQAGNALILAVTAVPTDVAAREIQAVVQAAEADIQDERQQLMTAVILLAIALAIAIAALIFALRRRFVRLDHENVVLHQEKEDAQEQLMQSAKLSAIGQMVAGITHEINTPLSYVRTVFELFKERMVSERVIEALAASGADDDDPENDAHYRQEELMMMLDDGLHGIDEIATLVRTMKNFSRFDRGHAESFSVIDGLESALLIARSQLKYVAEVERDFDPVPNVVVAPSQIRQVFLNLINNAIDAMELTDRPGKLTLRTRQTASDTIRIEISDNGPGIPDDLLPKIFDPFFTTKPVGDGTGMGLSISYRIIENHGGTISVNTKPGRGTAFTITLPRHIDADQALGAGGPASLREEEAA